MIHIRRAMASDARAIAKIHISSWQAIYRGHMPDKVLDNLSIDEREQLWKTLIGNNVGIFVLEENNVLTGFVTFCSSRDEDVDPATVAEISAIYLHPTSWRKGFGKLLCNAAIEELKKSGYYEVTLWVLDDNQQARQFYEKIGFTNSFHTKIDEEDGYVLREVKYRKIL